VGPALPAPTVSEDRSAGLIAALEQLTFSAPATTDAAALSLSESGSVPPSLLVDPHSAHAECGRSSPPRDPHPPAHGSPGASPPAPPHAPAAPAPVPGLPQPPAPPRAVAHRGSGTRPRAGRRARPAAAQQPRDGAHALPPRPPRAPRRRAQARRRPAAARRGAVFLSHAHHRVAPVALPHALALALTVHGALTLAITVPVAVLLAVARPRAGLPAPAAARPLRAAAARGGGGAALGRIQVDAGGQLRQPQVGQAAVPDAEHGGPAPIAAHALGAGSASPRRTISRRAGLVGLVPDPTAHPQPRAEPRQARAPRHLRAGPPRPQGEGQEQL
jgi:hypothetical protein